MPYRLAGLPRKFVLITALLSATAASASDRLIPVDATQRESLRIATAPLEAHAGAISVGLPATVTIPPGQQRLVTAPVEGLVTEVRVAVGDTVKRGTPLIVLRSAALATVQQELANAATQLRLAEATLKREEALLREGIVPESRVQASRSAQAQARALRDEHRTRLALMGFGDKDLNKVEQGGRLGDTLTIVAPADGEVLVQEAVVGARVDAAAPLMRIGQLERLWLEIQSPAEVAAQVRPGQGVRVPGTDVSGRVILVGRTVSAAQTVLVRAEVQDPGGALRLNQTVTARIEAVSDARQWRVPARAIVRQGGQNWVFVEVTGGFEPMAVEVLSQSAQSAAVAGAFSGEERIVIEGVAALKAIWQGQGDK